MAFDGVTIHLVAAMAQNRAIGLDNKIPWHIKEDLQHFKRLTTGKAVIMGRKTLESIGRPLPQRKMFVISRQKTSPYDFVIVITSLEEALAAAQKHCLAEGIPPEAYIIGGEQIYREALEKQLVDFMHLTLIEQEFAGDAFFPEFDCAAWRLTSDEPHANGFRFQTWQKANGRTPSI